MLITKHATNLDDLSNCPLYFRFLLEYFPIIALKSNELLALNLGMLRDLLASDELNVKNEEIVFDTILRWINHDPDNRKSQIVPLLQCVRLGLLSTQYFVEKVKVSKHYIIQYIAIL